MNQTINIGIASLPERKDSLKKALESLTNQADNIYVVLNYGGQEAPDWINYYRNVMWATGDNRLGSSHKMTMASQVNGMFISWDDDIEATDGVIDYLVSSCLKYECATTLHGKHYGYDRPVKSYRRSIVTNVRCLGSWHSDILVDVGGTGCLCFNTNQLKISLDDFHHKNMSDVEFSKKAHESSVPIMALKHDKGIVKYLPPKGTTIWNTSSDDTIQTSILNSFLK
jgi:hypothetical protein